MTKPLLIATGFWLILVVLAMVNGYLRETILLPWLGEQAALPLSGLSLSLLVLIASWLMVSVIGPAAGGRYIIIGLLWLALTLLFEIVFAHFVIGKSWSQLLQLFNVMQGNLFLLVIVTSAVSPWFIAHLRSYTQ